jgi:uncharacterized protein YbbK (DUF523 family)
MSRIPGKWPPLRLIALAVRYNAWDLFGVNDVRTGSQLMAEQKNAKRKVCPETGNALNLPRKTPDVVRTLEKAVASHGRRRLRNCEFWHEDERLNDRLG